MLDISGADAASGVGRDVGHGSGGSSSEDLRGSISDSNASAHSSEYQSVASDDLLDVASADSGPGDGDDEDPSSEPSEGAVAVAVRAHPRAGLSVFDGDRLVAAEAIKWNPIAKDFYAVCCVHGGGCRLTRTANASRLGRRAQGRPLGFLAAWAIQTAADPLRFETRAEHLRLCRPSHADRLAARAALNKPEQQDLLHEFSQRERPQGEDEDEEPAECCQWQKTLVRTA